MGDEGRRGGKTSSIGVRRGGVAARLERRPAKSETRRSLNGRGGVGDLGSSARSEGVGESLGDGGDGGGDVSPDVFPCTALRISRIRD